MATLLDRLQTLNIVSLTRRVNRMEARMSQFDDELAQINDDTNSIATELDDLRSQIAAGDASAAAKLQPIADRLRSMASDGSAPAVPSA